MYWPTMSVTVNCTPLKGHRHQQRSLARLIRCPGSFTAIAAISGGGPP